MLYNYLGAGYEVRLPISLSRDFEPLKSDLRRLQFCISGLVEHKKPIKKIPPIAHKMNEKNIQVFDIKTGFRKVLFSDAFKNEEINFLHYIFLPFIDGGWF